MSDPRSLVELLGAIRPDDPEGDITCAEILSRLGGRSFAAVILAPALLLVSPLSAIPGVPTFAGLFTVLVSLQWILAREHVWLPQFVLLRTIAAHRVVRAVDGLSGPAKWIDGHSQRRLSVLIMPPFSFLAKVTILLIAASWPLLELLPMVTSIGAFSVALLSFGVMARDGVYLAAGYASLAVAVGVIGWLTGVI